MQSSHACAGFMKVGRFCKKSPPERLREVISQLLGHFAMLLGALCALLGALGTSFCRTVFSLRFFVILVENGSPREKSAARASAFGYLDGGFTMCF